MMRRLVSALVLVVVAGVCVAVPPVSVSAASGVCEDLPGASLAGGELVGSTPVVLVHGFTGSNVSWFAPIDQAIDDDVEVHNRSFVEQLLRIDGVSVWLFEYHDVSARWVTDPRIGPALADLLECLSENGGQPAVLAVHSMGGLAARYALSLVDDSEIVSGMVTFGTPHLGSDFAAFIRDVAQDNSTSGGFLGPVKAAVRYSLQLCGQTKTVNADYDCGWLDGVPPVDSEAGQALITGSRELGSLSPVPDHVRTVGLAGEIEIVVQDSKWGFFYESREPWPIGDIMVSVDSATAMSDESRSWTCQLNFKKGYAISDDARQLFELNYDDGKERGISALMSNPCQHSNLMHTVEITNEALYHINQIAEDQLGFTWTADGVVGLPWGTSRENAEVFMNSRLGEPTWEYDNADSVGDWCRNHEIELFWPGVSLSFTSSGELVAASSMGAVSREGLYATMPLVEAQAIYPAATIENSGESAGPLSAIPMWIYRSDAAVVSGFVYDNFDGGSTAVIWMRVSVPGYEANCFPYE